MKRRLLSSSDFACLLALTIALQAPAYAEASHAAGAGGSNLTGGGRRRGPNQECVSAQTVVTAGLEMGVMSHSAALPVMAVAQGAALSRV
jgi:hypothetical protein